MSKDEKKTDEKKIRDEELENIAGGGVFSKELPTKNPPPSSGDGGQELYKDAK